MCARIPLFVFALLAFGIAVRAEQQVEIRTSFGKIVVVLDRAAAPKTCDAFLSYVRRHVYAGSTFFENQTASINGGKPGPEAAGFQASGNFVPSAPPGEFSLKHVRGAIGLGRTVGDCNPARLTNSTRFYIIRSDAPQYDGQFSLFGRVVAGMDVVDQISVALAKDKSRPIKLDMVLVDAG